jgi:hypothetical protein
MKSDDSSNDVKIIQDIKIVQQIVKDVLHSRSGEGVTLNVVNIGQILHSYSQRNLALPDLQYLPPKELDLRKFVDALPEPRLDSLIRIAYEIALKSFEYQKDAACWLGISERTMSYQRMRLGLDKEPLKLEEKIIDAEIIESAPLDKDQSGKEKPVNPEKKKVGWPKGRPRGPRKTNNGQ